MPLRNHNLLILFARAPVAGQVKTRLLSEFNEQQAVDIYQQLIEHSVTQAMRLKQVDVELHCTPDIQHTFFRHMHELYRLRLCQQSEGDLGQRMATALFNNLLHYRKVMLMGVDVASIDTVYLQTAFASLDDHPLVLAPAEDGGYGLVGMTRPAPLMFSDINWGSDKVLQQTIERLEPDYPLLLDTVWDVDRPEDVTRFQRLLVQQQSN